jgi:hypothetical protein
MRCCELPLLIYHPSRSGTITLKDERGITPYTESDKARARSEDSCTERRRAGMRANPAENDKNSKPPLSSGLSLRVFRSARVTDVCLLLRFRLPFVFKRLPHGKLFFTLDVDRLPSFLDVTPEYIAKLRSRFCPPALSAASPHTRKVSIDSAAPELAYRRMLGKGPLSTQTELARHFEVSESPLCQSRQVVHITSGIVSDLTTLVPFQFVPASCLMYPA